MQHRALAALRGRLHKCPNCGSLTDYQSGYEYECPDCEDTGYSPDMHPHHIFVIRR